MTPFAVSLLLAGVCISLYTTTDKAGVQLLSTSSDLR